MALFALGWAQLTPAVREKALAAYKMIHTRRRCSDLDLSRLKTEIREMIPITQVPPIGNPREWSQERAYKDCRNHGYVREASLF